MIVIVDFGLGNLRNVQKAFERVGCSDVVITADVGEIRRAKALVLAGVGAFGDAMDHLREQGAIEPMWQAVMERRTPVLGICLGMQLLATEGYEGGRGSGLGYLPMVVPRLDPRDPGLRLPHIGWDTTHIRKRDSVLFRNIEDKQDFYYVHSYHAVCETDDIVAATFEYGQECVCTVERDNIFGTQFHPEKSHQNGLMLIRNFVEHASAWGTEA